MINCADYYTIQHFDSLDSTNLEARRQANKGAANGTVIIANQQTAGKGRLDRNWISPKGNLYFSLLLRPDIAIHDMHQLTFVSALALKGALSHFTGHISLKWPNDILMNERKLAGILLESSVKKKQLDYIIIGMGVNIHSYPEEVMYPATCLAAEIQPSDLLESILESFARHYDHWQQYGFTPIKNQWLESAYKLEQEIQVNGFRGIFEDIDENGNLLLKLQAGEHKVIFVGDVSYSRSHK